MHKYFTLSWLIFILVFQSKFYIMEYSHVQDIDKNLLLGKFQPSKHPDFEKISIPYTNRDNMYLQKEVLLAFKQMHSAAKEDGVKLTIISSTRTYYQQKIIWENKWNGNTLVNGINLRTSVFDDKERAVKILTYSSMPGTSRHHWGTDFDLNSLNPEYFTYGKGKKEYEWLEKYAIRFGFCQPYKYKGKSRIDGYEDEPWHWSYLPIARAYLDEYMKNINFVDISGFIGYETAQDIDVISKYVLSINEECK